MRTRSRGENKYNRKLNCFPDKDSLVIQSLLEQFFCETNCWLASPTNTTEYEIRHCQIKTTGEKHIFCFFYHFIHLKWKHKSRRPPDYRPCCIIPQKLLSWWRYRSQNIINSGVCKVIKKNFPRVVELVNFSQSKVLKYTHLHITCRYLLIQLGKFPHMLEVKYHFKSFSTKDFRISLKSSFLRWKKDVERLHGKSYILLFKEIRPAGGSWLLADQLRL